MAGSLLHSLKLDELITEDIEKYIQCASKLTEDLTYRKNIIQRLKEAKLTSPNFQPRLFVNHWRASIKSSFNFAQQESRQQ